MFSLSSMEFVTFDQIFSILFWVSGGFNSDSTRGSVPVWIPPLVTEPCFAPLRNKFLATPCIRDDIMTSPVSLYLVQKMTDNNIPWVAVGCQQSAHTPAGLFAMDVVAETEQQTGHLRGVRLLTVDMYSCRLPKALEPRGNWP